MLPMLERHLLSCRYPPVHSLSGWLVGSPRVVVVHSVWRWVIQWLRDGVAVPGLVRFMCGRIVFEPWLVRLHSVWRWVIQWQRRVAYVPSLLQHLSCRYMVWPWGGLVHAGGRMCRSPFACWHALQATHDCSAADLTRRPSPAVCVWQCELGLGGNFNLFLRVVFGGLLRRHNPPAMQPLQRGANITCGLLVHKRVRCMYSGCGHCD